MPFPNPVAGGGGDLVRPRLRSPNYVAGVSGWSINQNGTAEFNNVVLRGSLLAKTGNSEIELTANPTRLRYNPDVVNYTDGTLTVAVVAGIQGLATLTTPVPSVPGTDDPASIEMYSDVVATDAGSNIRLTADTIDLAAVDRITLQASRVFGPTEIGYNPTWSAAAGTTTLGDGSLDAAYVRDGQIFFRIVLVWGTTSAQSVAGSAWRFTLPEPASPALSNNKLGVQIRVSDVSTGVRYFGSGVVDSNNDRIFSIFTHGASLAVSNTSPFAAAVGDAYTLWGWYDPA